MSRSLVAPVPDNDGGTPQPYVHCPQRPTCKGQHFCPTACYPEQSKVGFDVLDTKPGSVSCKSAHRSFRPRCKAKLVSCQELWWSHGVPGKVHPGSRRTCPC